MEILLRVVDKINPNCPKLDSKCLKRGDVVVCVPDGHNWGKQELINPIWRIIRAPNLTAEQAEMFKDPEDNESETSNRRDMMFNFDDPNLPQAFLDFIADDSRASPYYDTEWPEEPILALKKKDLPMGDNEDFLVEVYFEEDLAW
jgi:hypothetical protein